VKRALLGIGCLLLSGVVMASGIAAVRKSVQASMRVTGNITVAPDGHVAAYTLDHAGKLPSAVANLLNQTVPRWTFESISVDGHPASAKAAMSIRVVAVPQGGERYTLSVAGVVFGGGEDDSGRTLVTKHREAPIYPPEALRARAAGTVYVLVRVDRQGKVAEAVARQVDLRVVGSDRDMASWRDMFAKATLRAVRKWTFKPPVTGEEAAAPYWLASLPVDYSPRGFNVPAAELPSAYGQWQSYVPGPLQPVPWADSAQLAGSADAVPDGGIFQPNPQLHLRTPLGG
jgi:TonB family protein